MVDCIEKPHKWSDWTPSRNLEDCRCWRECASCASVEYERNDGLRFTYVDPHNVEWRRLLRGWGIDDVKIYTPSTPRLVVEKPAPAPRRRDWRPRAMLVLAGLSVMLTEGLYRDDMGPAYVLGLVLIALGLVWKGWK